MRILAHYTVYNNDIFNLHVFDIEEQHITHFPVEVETAHTLFLQGILIVAGSQINEQDIDNLHRLIEENRKQPLSELAKTLNSYLSGHSLHYCPGTLPKLLKVTFPYQRIAILK